MRIREDQKHTNPEHWTSRQCSGSETFWYGYGAESRYADPYHKITDPRIWVFYWCTFTSVFQEQATKKLKTVEINVFCYLVEGSRRPRNLRIRNTGSRSYLNILDHIFKFIIGLGIFYVTVCTAKFILYQYVESFWSCLNCCGGAGNITNSRRSNYSSIRLVRNLCVVFNFLLLECFFQINVPKLCSL